MGFADKVDRIAHIPDDPSTGEKDWKCHDCKRHLKGSWHHCPTCCLSFVQLAGFDHHRVGPYDGDRHCLTAQDLASDPRWEQLPDRPDVWRYNPRGA